LPQNPFDLPGKNRQSYFFTGITGNMATASQFGAVRLALKQTLSKKPSKD